MVEKNMKANLYELRVLFCHCVLGTNWVNSKMQKAFQILIQKLIKSVNIHYATTFQSFVDGKYL